MKKNLLKNLVLVAALTAGGVTVNAQETGISNQSVKNPTADVWLRSDNLTYRGNGDTMEMKNYEEEVSGDTKKTFFCGLMSFDLDAVEDGWEITNASLRLVTRYAKGDRAVSIYAYDGTIDETTIKYENSSADINSALEKDAIANFKLKSYGVWSPTDGGVRKAEDYDNVDAWTNTIDVTDYVKSLTTNNVKLLLAKDANENSSSQIYTKEATDVVNKYEVKDASGNVIEEVVAFTFKAEDLVPQLTVTYTQTTGISDIAATTQENAAGVVYNLAGQRVDNPQRGTIYIQNGHKYIAK